MADPGIRPREQLRLGPLTIEPATRRLVHDDGREEILEPRVIQLLAVLVKADGAILSRDDLVDLCWDGRAIGDDAVFRALSRLRHATEGIAAGVFRLETIPKAGYRLIRLDGAPAGSVPPVEQPGAAGAPAIGRRTMIGGGVALGAAALAGGGWWVMGRGGQAKENSIAVLPFANLSGDPAKAYFSDGMAEELRSALARIAGLKVAARTSSEKMREADAKEAAAKLGVSHVLTGSVRKGDGMIRVSAQLVDGTTGLEQWSQSYDRPEGDAIAVQSGIAESVANALSLTLGRAAAMLGGTQSPVAYDAYLRGRRIVTDTPESTRTALAAFDAAIAVDPRFAAAHAERAVRLSNLIVWTNLAETPPTQRLAVGAALRAVELEPLLPTAHYAVGMARVYQLQLRAGDAAFRRALELPGLSSDELSIIGLFQLEMGLGGAGFALVEQALNLDPLNPDRERGRISGLIGLRRYAEAVSAMAAFDAANRDEPTHPLMMAGALLWSGDAKRALATYQRALPDWRRYRGEALAHAKLGNRAASDRTLAAMRASVDLIAFQTAEVYAMQGERALALVHLAHAVRIRDPGLMGLRSSPALDSLRADPRFAAIEEQVGFPPA